jgi:hypothetical protein
MTMNRISSQLIMGALLLGAAPGPASAQERPATGAGSVQLPAFDPDQQIGRIREALRRLEPVSRSIREANDRLLPLYEKFRQAPTLANQGRLEKELSRFTLVLSRRIRAATQQRERVAFAFQDLSRGVQRIGHTVAAYAASIAHRADEQKQKAAALQGRRRQVAEAWEVARGAARERLKQEFKELERRHDREAFRARLLTALAGRYAKLEQGVGRLGETFGRVRGRLGQVFDRLEDNGMKLAYAARFRQDATEFMTLCNNMFGTGGEGIQAILAQLKSVGGQFQVFDKLNLSLDDMGTFTPLLEKLDGMLDGLDLDPAHGGVDPAAGDPVEARMRRLLQGESNPPETKDQPAVEAGKGEKR